jgi:hypothetical protein
MTIAQAIATQLLLVIFPGLVLHRSIAGRLLNLDKANAPAAEIPETDLVIYGLLPGLAIASTIGTILALFGLFRMELFAAVMVGAVIWRRREAIVTLVALAGNAKAIWRSLARGELMTLVAIGIFAKTIFGLVVYAQLPSENVDVWNHQVPLAQSIVSHAGFVFPQIDHMFYGTNPIFFNMLFAEALLFVDDVIAANVVNSLLYLGFLLTLLACARRARAVAAVVLSLLIIRSGFFSPGAAEALTDLPRTCFTVLGLVFTYRYLRDRRAYFLFAAGLLAGGAVAGKYTELLTPALIGLSLIPRLARDRTSWAAAGIFVAAFLPVASYPYVRNWLLLGNPVYPFLFGHPGLSDAWMADLMVELTRPFDPANRTYVTNLLSLQGWHDFFTVIYQWFFSGFRSAYAALILIGIGLWFRRSYIAYFLVWSLFLAIVWYTMMFNAIRWAMPFYLTMLAGGFLSWAWLVDCLVSYREPLSFDWRTFLHAKLRESRLARLPYWLTPNTAMRAALAGLALYPCISAARQLRQDGLAALMPPWADRQLGEASLEPGGIEAYLARTRKGYQLYRFIADKNLRTVFQPFDNGAIFYQAAYNGGHNGGWILPYWMVPTGPEDFDNFLRSNEIKYVVYRTSLAPIEVERLGPERMNMAYALLQTVLPTSRRILVDPFGWELYAIDGAPVPPP